jgi:hypothetical protein
MPNVVQEDGSIVAGANSFVDVAYVTSWAALRGRSEWDASASTALLEGAVLRAADYLKNEARYVYRGSRRSVTQTMPWPREGATEYRGPTLANNYISWRLKDAQAALAVREFAVPFSLQPDLVRGGATKNEKVDVIDVTYQDNAPVETLIQEVQGLLLPLLLLTTSATPVPYQASPVDPTPFVSGTFDDPSSSSINNLTQP